MGPVQNSLVPGAIGIDRHARQHQVQCFWLSSRGTAFETMRNSRVQRPTKVGLKSTQPLVDLPETRSRFAG